ncbi:hypothetical protein V8F20_008572 [Naviculisporaceae sp. PSN 640]
MPTILLEVNEWTQASAWKWEAVVGKVKLYIDETVCDTPELKNVNFSVEMVSSDLLKPKYLSPLGTDSPFYDRIKDKWTDIKGKIFKIGESQVATKGKITAISIFRLGFETEEEFNPITVYVSVSYDSPEEDWPPITKLMQDTLDELKCGLKIHIEHNEPEYYPLFRSIPVEGKGLEYQWRQRYNPKVTPGADIGCALYLRRQGDNKETHPVVGTFGCWLEITRTTGKGKDEKQIVGITNYHVLRSGINGFRVGLEKTAENGTTPKHSTVLPPQDNSQLLEIDKNGFLPAKGKRFAEVEQPSRVKHNKSVQVPMDELESIPDPSDALRDQLDVLRERKLFFQNGLNLLGVPYLGSGFCLDSVNPQDLGRDETKRRLDFALFHPTNRGRIGENKIDTRPFSEKYLPSICPKNYTTTLRNMEMSMHDMEAGHHLYKIGAATDCTIGEFSCMKSTVELKDDKHMNKGNRYSEEFMIVGVSPSITESHAQEESESNTRKPFADKGDSGAVVWDRNGCVMGLLFRGQVPNQTRSGCAYVTPIEHVFGKIKKMDKNIKDIKVLPPRDERLGGRY